MSLCSFLTMLWFAFLSLLAMTLASSPKRPIPPGCIFPTGPYVPPKCGENEYFEVCSYKCPPESCPTNPPTTCDPGDGCCKNACRCRDGFLRNSEGKCVRPCDCDDVSEPLPPQSCPRRCRPTCRVPNPPNCIARPKCYCKTDYVWDEDKKKCVKIEECPYGIGCNGDINASIRNKPPPCPSTCDMPNEMPCKAMGLPVGCVCNPGFILSNSSSDGKCIRPDFCPGGNPCGVNGTFASCRIDCPSEFCPVDDRHGTVICDPAPNCPTGCICKHKYVWRNKQDRQCILSQECPKINCTRQNEHWDSCPSPCFTDFCEDFDRPKTQCKTKQEAECYPQCVCKRGFARHPETFTCIQAKLCPRTPCQPEIKIKEVE